MSKTFVRRKDIIDRLLAYGILYEDAASLSDLFQKWVKESGEEWTVSRFKKLKLEFIHYISHQPGEFKAPWVQRGPDGIPSKVFRRFWTNPYYVEHKQSVLNALMIYTSLVSNQVTEDQERKFLDSARSEPVAVSLRCKSRVLQSGFFEVLKGGKPRPRLKLPLGPEPLFTKVRVPNRRVPYIKGTRPESDLWPDLRFAAESAICEQMYNDYWGHMTHVIPWSILRNWRFSSTLHDYVGVISYIQEPGYKLRAVANPNRVLQQSLEPLKQLLSQFLQRVPEDCTFNQEKGVEWIKDRLTTGSELFSVDLSDATNLFPFSLQELVLKEVIRPLVLDGSQRTYDELLNMFTTLAKGQWRLPNGDSLVFKAGQPLGLGPSFFSFALAHHALLYSLDGCGKYVILGDDIVISDKALHKRYLSNLHNLGCVVSKEKSLEGSFAEFASRLISPTQVYRQWKWREISIDNVLDICRNLGPRFLNQVPRFLRKAVEAVAPLPTEVGGLGWNPQGIPLLERLQSAEAQLLLSPKEEVVAVRKAYTCMTTDFVSSHFRAQEEIPDEEQDYQPTLYPNHIALQWFEYRRSSYGLDDSKLYWYVEKTYRPDRDLGDTVLVPSGKIPKGYLPWYQETYVKGKGGGVIRSILSLINGGRDV